MNTIDQINGFVTGANLLLPQLSAFITIGDYAIRQLWALWRQRNPEGTFEDFITELRRDAEDVKSLAGAKLLERGFVQDADGTWHRPVDPAPPTA